ncbi:LOW QUALITY PROTEIN: coiled-coil domain-containing protein 158 [Geothlypis trichas]
MHPHHICHLESTVCQLCSQLEEVKRICENKVQDLEKQLHLAHSETAEAQTGSTQNSKLRTLVISQTRNTGCGRPMQTSLQFAECQCIMQCQEQEAMQCWLQHTLDVRELQGPGYSSASASGKLQHSLCPSGVLPAHILQILSPRVFPCSLHSLFAAGPAASPEPSPAPGKLGSPQGAATGIASQPMETSEPTSKRLQNKMESLQNLLESSQIKTQAMSPMIRTQEVKTECKEKERKLSK